MAKCCGVYSRVSSLFHNEIFACAITAILSSLTFATAFADSIQRQQLLGTIFKNPEPVEIQGLPDGAGGSSISTEEPFLSRDGRFLFFNTATSENNKDLHYAERVSGTWKYRGEIKSSTGVIVNNSKEVQANPSVDRDYNLYFVESGVKRMIRTGIFSPETGLLSNIREFEGVPRRQIRLFAQKLHGNMGVEVSADGGTLYFSRAIWRMKGLSVGKVLDSDILLSRRINGRFVFDEVEARHILKNINSGALEYAASISADGLELFFTRLLKGDIGSGRVRSAIMHSRRTSITEPFALPVVIEAIGRSDFVEGPAISSSGAELYYHKHDGQKFRMYRVTR